MKFTDLPPTNRSILAALCAAGAAGLRTDALGRCTSPRHSTPQEAANLLNNLRQLGLVYSQQKPDNQSYALWKASEYGVAVFMSRPDEVPAPGAAASVATSIANGCAQSNGSAKSFLIVRPTGGCEEYRGTREQALAQAQTGATKNPGTEYSVYEIIGVAHMPVPQAQITLL